MKAHMTKAHDTYKRLPLTRTSELLLLLFGCLLLWLRPHSRHFPLPFHRQSLEESRGLRPARGLSGLQRVLNSSCSSYLMADFILEDIKNKFLPFFSDRFSELLELLGQTRRQLHQNSRRHRQQADRIV